MSRRSILHRMLTVACSAWIALNGAARGAPGACVMHDGAGAAAHAHDARGTTQPSPPAGHMHGDAHRQANPSPDTPGDSHQCSCAVDCCGVPPVAFISPSPHVVAEPLLVMPVSRPPVRTVIALTRRHALPFANGPPAARLA